MRHEEVVLSKVLVAELGHFLALITGTATQIKGRFTINGRTSGIASIAPFADAIHTGGVIAATIAIITAKILIFPLQSSYRATVGARNRRKGGEECKRKSQLHDDNGALCLPMSGCGETRM